VSKQTEDTLYEIHQKVERLGIRKIFDKQLRKMANQKKHQHKTACERWEYAFIKINDKSR